ncbi:MAG: glycosyltransferase [Opitutaceae bacterium]
MNLLFVNYGDFTSNSVNHLSGFTRALTAAGHRCIIAVPDNLDSLSAVPDPHFRAATYAELLATPALFADGRPADLIHAWTPREGVRQFVVDYKRLAPSRLVVHLEDNEEHLVESYMGQPLAILRDALERDFPRPLVNALPHPVRQHTLLRLADGVSVIIDTLRSFVPPGIPILSLPPGVDFDLYQPQEAPADLRDQLGLQDDERVIVFTGSSTFANESEIRDLYLAVHLLNARGCPTRLIRTGFNSPTFATSLPEDWKRWTLDLGFIDKGRLPGLLALADVLVQPGHPGPFNDYRLPSKLPEFLASGRPVVTVASNLGLQLTDGVNARVLADATPEAIADACLGLFTDPDTARRLGAGGAAFARAAFDLNQISSRLIAFYSDLVARPQSAVWLGFKHGSDTALLARRLHQQLASVSAPISATWSDMVGAADDLARLCRDLEFELANLDTRFAHARAHLEADRDEWKRVWGLTDQHAKNIEATCRATQNHAHNLEAVLRGLEKDLARVETARTHAETQLRAARQQAAAFEAELLRTEAAFTAELQRAEATLATTEARFNESLAAFSALRLQYENLENQLTAARALHAQSEARLVASQQQVAAYVDSLAQSQYLLASTRARALAHGENARQEMDKLREQMKDALRQRDETIAQRDRKIQTMQTSFSWQATSPLRALRRWLIDPFRSTGKSPVPLRITEATLPESRLSFRPDDFVDPIRSFTFSVDYPQLWSFGINKVVVRGWCLTREASVLKKVRARIAQRIYPGVYGLKRMDVLAALRDTPQAEYSGFKIDVLLEETDEEIFLEVCDSHGVWHRFFQSPLKVGPQHGLPELTSYERWASTYDQHTPESLAALRLHVTSFAQRPLISVIMPVYHRDAGDEKWLLKAIASVRSQVYPYWELCIADDASPAPHVRPLLERLAREDERIKPVFREKNGHISHASNSALEKAKGEFVALLDHDDELAPHALYEVVALLNAQPDTDLVYTDEDKIDEEGRRHEPYFKPDFLPDLFTSQNYLSHLSVYRTRLIREAGGFRPGYEGSQDWDLALRVSERSSAARIRHIPKVLYHWRAIPGSTALLLSEKNYPVEAARRALSDHFRRVGEAVELLAVPGDHWRVKRPIPSPAPLVSLVIPSRNGLKLLSRCVDTLLSKTTYPNFELIIVDNGSDDPATLDYFRQIESARVAVLRYDAPFNYSAINNHGVRHARGEIIGLLNNDLEIIHGDWLDEMVSHAVRPDIGCVGAMLYYPNETVQHAGVIVGLGGVAGHIFRDFPRGTEGKSNRARLVQNYSAVTAACLLVRRSTFEQVGGLDETLAVAFNDIDFCLKVRAAGFRNLWTPFAECYHHESASRGAEDNPEKHERFRREVEVMLARWKDVIAHDPAYNPNLTLELTDYTLSAPPRPWAP